MRAANLLLLLLSAACVLQACSSSKPTQAGYDKRWGRIDNGRQPARYASRNRWKPDEAGKPATSSTPGRPSANATAHRESDGEAVERRSAPASSRVEGVLRTAKSYLRTPYRFGGTDRGGVDCSGLMMLAFRSEGIQLPRTSGEQATQGRPVSRRGLQPGDLIFFATSWPGKVSHSGLVVSTDNNSVQFIHSSTSSGVRIDDLSLDYWNRRYLFGRRIID